MTGLRNVTTRYICPHCATPLENFPLPGWLRKLDLDDYLKVVLARFLSAGGPIHWKSISANRKYAAEHISRIRSFIRDHDLPYSIPPCYHGTYILQRLATKDNPSEREEVVHSSPRAHNL